MYRAVLALALSLVVPASLTAQTKAPQLGAGLAAAEIEEQVRVILASKYPCSVKDNPGMATGYRALFKAVGPDGLRALQTHANDGVAIQAAWEQVRLSVPEKEPARETVPDPGKLAWFLGFLEGRARVQAPEWWTEMVLGARANRRDNIFPIMPKVGGPYHRAGLEYVRAPRDTTIERQDNVAHLVPTVTLRVGKESVRVREELLGKSNAGRVIDDVSVLLTSARCYLATHGDVGYSYPLRCIDRDSGKVLWKSDVWATFWGAASGHHSMCVAVTDQGGRIVVFGASCTGFHVESFRTDDGTPLFRFSSSY